MARQGLRILMLGFYPAQEGMVLGGTQAVVSALAPALSTNEDVAHVTVLSFHRGEVQSHNKQVNDKLLVRYVRGQKKLSVLTRSFLSVGRARRIIAEVKPDIIHGHGMGWSGDIATQISPNAVVTVHGMIQQEVRLASKGTLRDRLRIHFVDYMAKQVLSRARVVVSISSYASQMLNGMIRGHHVSIPNPIAPEFFIEPGSDPGRKSVIFAGVLRRRKNVEGLLNAFKIAHKHHPDARFVIVGPTPDATYAQEIRDKVATLQLENAVDFVGYVENQRLAEEMHQARVVSLFSHEETLPTVIAQALAMGKPVVTSRVGGVADMITDGENGFMVDPGDEQSFAARLSTLLDSPELCLKMGAEGRKIALQRFTPAAVARQTVDAYQLALPKV